MLAVVYLCDIIKLHRLTELWKNIPLNIYFLTKVIKKKVCIGYRRHCSLSSLHCYSLSFIFYLCSIWGNNLSETAFRYIIPNQCHSKYLSYPKGQKIGRQRRLFLRVFLILIQKIFEPIVGFFLYSQNGTCYTAQECSQRGGSNSGTCALGYGTCCTCELFFCFFGHTVPFSGNLSHMHFSSLIVPL